MTNSKKKQGVCKICYHKASVGYNFGAIACDACTAFFRRTVRMNCEYKCIDLDDACNEVAVREVTSRHACKKCRLDRCIREGMEARYVREEQKPDPAQQQAREARKRQARIERMTAAAQNARIPLLSAMFKALRNMEYFSKPMGTLRCHGLSEPGEQFLTFPRVQRLVEKQLRFYRELLNHVPIINDLGEEGRDMAWKNTSMFYHVIDMCYHHFTQFDPSDRIRKCFIFRNCYLEADFSKLIYYCNTVVTSRSSNPEPVHPTYIRDITSNLLHTIQYIQGHIYSLLSDVIKTPDDWATLLLVMILQKTYCGPMYGKYGQFVVMDRVWEEVNVYYKMNGRDPATWGNLIFLMSSMESLYKDYAAGVYKVRQAITKTVFPKMECDEKAKETQLHLQLQRRHEEPLLQPPAPKIAKIVIIIPLLLFLIPNPSVQLNDNGEDNNLVGILIERANENNSTLLAPQSDDSVTSTQVERMFETIQKMNNLLTNMDMHFSSKIEALSKRVDVLEANQGSVRRSLIAEWTQIGEQKFAKLFTVASNWTEANAICSTLCANLTIVNSELENRALTALLAQSSDQVFWIGSKVQFQIDMPTDRFHNFTNDKAESGCAAVTREGVWRTRSCDERHPFVCELSRK